MGQAREVAVSERQRGILSRWVRNKAETPYRLVERSRIVLLSATGVTNVEQAGQLGVDRQRVRRWRARWARAEERLAAAEREGASDSDLAELVRCVLTDEQRPGGPSTGPTKLPCKFQSPPRSVPAWRLLPPQPSGLARPPGVLPSGDDVAPPPRLGGSCRHRPAACRALPASCLRAAEPPSGLNLPHT